MAILAEIKKDAQLVKRAIQSIPYSLQEIELFHTDRGKEFDNELIDLILETFGIQRSLSKPGCPYDNAVSEATYKAFKTEFVSQYQFETMAHLELECFDYVIGGIIIGSIVLLVIKHQLRYAMRRLA